MAEPVLRELVGEADFKAAFPVMHELRTHLDEAAYLELLDEMVPRGYRLFALEADGTIAALAGVGRGTNFYYERYMWVYDLITRDDVRSRGYGGQLLAHVESVAEQEGCGKIALASALHRVDAHRFYLDRAGYEKVSYTFSKDL